MTQQEAIKEAASLLRDEANELQCLQSEASWKALPHRAKCAITREYFRLKQIADVIEGKEER